MLADVLLTAEARRDGGLGGVRSLELGCGVGLCSLVELAAENPRGYLGLAILIAFKRRNHAISLC